MSESIVLDATDVAVAVPSRRLSKSPPVRLVSGINLTVRRGETYGLVGESGSGKSTTARAIARLLPLASGRVVIGGVDVSTLGERALRPHRRRVQMVFQDPYSSLDPLMTVGETIAEGLTFLGLGRAERAACVRELLTMVGLDPSFAARYPAEFSGGQRQRIAIARALGPRPDLLICDEAVSALDASTQQQILDVLLRLRDELGLAMLFISHDLGVVRRLCDRTSIMYCGEVVEHGLTTALLEAPCHPFSVALVSAAPVASPQLQRVKKRILLTGDMPSILAPPSGCHFHPRCPIAMEICRTETPPTVATHFGGEVRCHAHTSGPSLHGQPVADLVYAASGRKPNAHTTQDDEGGRHEISPE